MFELYDVLIFCIAYAGVVMASWAQTLIHFESKAVRLNSRK